MTLLGTKTLQALIPGDLLSLNRQQCVRQRFAESSCRNCFTCCPTAAISWQETGLHWEPSSCQGCLLCVASCQTGAITATELYLGKTIQLLAENDRPILACTTKPETVGHARLPCLGILANLELLLVLQLATGQAVRLNLSGCQDCHNGLILPRVQDALKQLAGLTLDLSGEIIALTDKSQLDYQEQLCSRRDFFNLLKKRSKHASVHIAGRLQQTDKMTSYRDKNLPYSRRLLLQVIDSLPLAERKKIEVALFPQHAFQTTCQSCTGCVGICPTGALLAPEIPGKHPEFSATNCTGCRLCEQFCVNDGIKVND